ncbi:transcription initiation factor TFIID subunit 6 [Enteropsectra breve]|nr:transcription initiation factor TFIID subunit 6 [Enteropsectra breve]
MQPMLFSKETLKAFANSKGLADVDDEALRILSQDIEYRLKQVCQEAAKFMHSSHRSKLSIGDVNHALESRNVEPLMGYDSQEALVFRGMPCNIYYVPDEEIDIDEYLEKPLPKVPLKPYIQSHWLAIEGVQPPIQQNPVLIEKQEVKLESIELYQEEAELKQQNKHILTKELLMYFEKILQTIYNDPQLAAECVQNEAGIQQLVPYFIYHFKMEIKRNLSDSDYVITVLNMYLGLIRNKYIFIDSFLQDILPTLVSCLINSVSGNEVREKAAEVVKTIYDAYGSKYSILAPKIIKLLQNICYDASKAPDAHYGALYCLSLFPPQAVDRNLLDVVGNSGRDASEKTRSLLDILALRIEKNATNDNYL